MFTVAFEFRNPATGDPGVVRLAGGIWVGDVCTFEVTATDLGLAGVVRSDWRQPAPEFDLTDGSPDDATLRALVDRVAELLRPFHTGALDALDDDALASLYAGDYHARQGYATGSEVERRRKGVLADLTIRVTRPRKVLVAGCSAGECIRQLRDRGVEAWGFDLSADVERIAFPEVRPFVRRGSVAAIPFTAADGFDTVTAFDVLEHVPERQVPAMVAELRRLGVRWLVALIAHCEFQYLGHVTLRPLPWWDRALAGAFRRIPNHELEVPWPAVEPETGDPTKLLRVYEAIRRPPS